MYQFTRYGGVRPLGAALIVIGTDRGGKHIYQLDPRGMVLSGKALAIGKNSEAAIEELRSGYREDLTIRQALDLAIMALRKAEDGESPLEVGIATGSTFQKMSLEETYRLYAK
jgi:proteasome alpha subunit